MVGGVWKELQIIRLIEITYKEKNKEEEEEMGKE